MSVGLMRRAKLSKADIRQEAWGGFLFVLFVSWVGEDSFLDTTHVWLHETSR